MLLALFFRRRGSEWRVASLQGGVAWGTFLALATEGLSLARRLTTGWLVLAWGMLAGALLAWQLSRARRGARGATAPPRAERPSRLLRGLWLGVVLLLAVVALTGLVAAPNNWDSLAYHLPRVVQWAQAHELRHFPTPYLPQLLHPPFSEFVILHLQLLTGGDRFYNSVQWLALAGSVLGASVIAGQLGAGVRGQTFAAVVAATLPMAILQGSSTQNDLVVSFWIICFAVFARRTLDAEQVGFTDALWLGASLGLAMLTKATSYFFLAPFVVWVAVAGIVRLRWGAWRPALVIAGLALLLNVGHFGRNVALMGRPLASGEESTNQIRTPAAITSVVIRNLALHVGTRSVAINDRIDGAIRTVHGWLGLDVNDPRTTCWGQFWINRLNTYEDAAGNPVHLALIVAALAALAWRRALHGALGAHLLAVGAGFFLFCLMLRYQPWHSRLHTPLFLLAAPAVGCALEGTRWRRMADVTAALLLLAATPWLVFNRQRSLLDLGYYFPSIFRTSRIDQYFTHPDARPLRDEYVSAAEVVRRRGGDVGLLLPEDAFEYPLWVLLEPGRKVGRLGNVGVKNLSSRTAGPRPFQPPTVLRLRESYYGVAGWSTEKRLPDDDPALDRVEIDGVTYVRASHFGTLDVLVRESPVARSR